MLDRTVLQRIAIAVCLPILACSLTAAAEQPNWNLFRRDNLVAWCIVPFDAVKRGPRERAEMLQELQIRRVAYDWRSEHVGTFEQEILEYKRHGLEFFAFWSWHDEMERLIEKHDVHPQIWMTVPSPQGDSQAERLDAAANRLLPSVRRAESLGCEFGLYNHGGWGGEPETMIALCRKLRAATGTDHVGIVYNLHHGHGHIHDFAEVLEAMRPYLLCLNLNGMNDDADPKILPIGAGQHDRDLVRIIATSGYSGPIGILDHRNEFDARQSLIENLAGLERLVAELQQE